MRAAGFAEAAQQSGVARFDEDERGGAFAAQLAINSGQLVDLRAFARVHQQGRAFHFAAAAFIELAESGNQRDGKIIDAVEAEILEGVQDGPFARAGKPGEDYELAGASFPVGARHGGNGYAFTRRRCVLGMRRSSRYFATVRRVTWMPSSPSFLVICSSVSG